MAKFNLKALIIYGSIGSAFLILLANDKEIPFLETEWFQSWWWISLPIVAIYGTALYLGKRYMSKREAFNVKEALAYWNFTLAFFSLLGFYRNGSEFVYKLISDGFRATYCSDDYYSNRSIYFWYFLFVVSKGFEFGDTAFLVLSKKPVPFIHWFHHMVTMVYSFYIAVHLPAIGRWMSAMNFLVHTLMYAYYCFMANGIRIPKSLAKTITVLQIVQMFAGLTVDGLAVWAKYTPGSSCGNGGYTTEAGTIMYLFYVYLFLQFFYNAYLRVKPKGKVN